MAAGMTRCEEEGISGNCGPTCRAYLDGDCDCADEIEGREEYKEE